MSDKQNQPTKILMAEHEAIKTMLRVLENLASRLEAAEKVDPAHLQMALDFITGFADRCHHAKEENLLFPAMEAAGIPREGGPIGVMLTEHEEGRRHVRAIKEAADRLAKGEAKAASEFARHARGYASLLSDHIFKEDNILYAMADARLSPADQEKLREEFQRVEEEIVGRGEHARFESILEDLKNKYC